MSTVGYRAKVTRGRPAATSERCEQDTALLIFRCTRVGVGVGVGASRGAVQLVHEVLFNDVPPSLVEFARVLEEAAGARMHARTPCRVTS